MESFESKTTLELFGQLPNCFFAFYVVVSLASLFYFEYQWSCSSLVPIFYCQWFASSITFSEQYLLTLTYRESPIHLSHTNRCQVLITLSYGDMTEQKTTVVPITINKLLTYQNRLSSLVLIRSVEKLNNIRTANFQLECSTNCSHNNDPINLKESKLFQLQIDSLSVQNLLNANSIQIKVIRSIKPNAMLPTSMPSLKTSSFFECQKMNGSINYSFAIERPEAIDYNLIRSWLVNPSNRFIVFNFCAISMIFAMNSFILVLYYREINEEYYLLLFKAALLSSINSTIFLFTGMFLFVGWIQECLYVASFGRNFWGRFLYFGILLSLIVVGIGCLFGSLSEVNLSESGGSADYAASLDNRKLLIAWLGSSIFGITIFLLFEMLLFYCWNNGVLSEKFSFGLSCADCHVCVAAYELNQKSSPPKFSLTKVQ